MRHIKYKYINVFVFKERARQRQGTPMIPTLRIIPEVGRRILEAAVSLVFGVSSRTAEL